MSGDELSRYLNTGVIQMAGVLFLLQPDSWHVEADAVLHCVIKVGRVHSRAPKMYCPVDGNA